MTALDDNLKLASRPVGAPPVKRKAVAVRSPRAVAWQEAYAWAMEHSANLETQVPGNRCSANARRFADETTTATFGL